MSSPLLADLTDLVLPTTCVACGGAGRSLCGGCALDLTQALAAFGGPRSVRPDPTPPGFPPCAAVAAYDGPLATALRAFKDRDRRDLRALLGALLATSLAVAAGPAPESVVVVPAPSSAAARRRRGRDPLAEVAALAAAALPGRTPVARVVAQSRPVADQAGLGAQERAGNLAGAVVVRPAWGGRLAGVRVVVVDDVVTTGATLTECARVLRASGATVVGAATICATQRRAAPLPARA